MITNNVVYGGPALKVPAHSSFGQYVIDKLREHSSSGDAVALINGDTGRQTTYKQILQEIVNVATALKKIGVKRGDVVGLCSENRHEYIAAVVGAICCGATITTFNVQYTKDEMTHVLNISKPNTIFCSEEALKRNLSIFKSLPYLKNIIQFDGSPVDNGVILYGSAVSPLSDEDVRQYEPAACGFQDVVFTLYSSGTTGLPKGVMLTHLNALYAASTYSEPSPDQPPPRYLTVVPWYHAYGLMSTINYLAVKKLLVYLSGFNPQKYLSAIQEYKISVLMVVPPIVVFLSKSPLVEQYDMSSVNVVWCGAAPLGADTIREARKRLPNCRAILQAYGMTETSLAATSTPDDANAEPKPGSGGFPLPGVKIKVVDVETRQKLGPMQTGEIFIEGPIVMKGYAGDEAATRAALDAEGYIRTGDVGYYDRDGHFFVVDRLKELIKYKGNQVPPAEVEKVLLQHAGVAECGVVGAPDELAGELPTAFVVRRPGAAVHERELLAFTAARLSPAKRLHGGVIFVDEIPKNPSGKILRRVLKQRLQDRVKSKL